jgi:hypothetical protein
LIARTHGAGWPIDIGAARHNVNVKLGGQECPPHTFSADRIQSSR